MAYQSLYRRYRPRRFAEVLGQEPVTTALRNAVRDGRVGHAYLFSGPRGTGKTSTARILAKALNCTDPQAGEPDCACESCLAMEAGRSYDLQELDAASNSGVEAMRTLIDRVALGSPGRTKVYILDEVHMLTAAASNALLKTLEEPPPHVVFVLATTDPHKVLPTIRSRTQHFEFHLLPAEVLEQHVRWVAQDAELHVDDDAVAQVLRAGGGSARDTLSALDRIVAGGGDEQVESVDHLVDALAEHDTALALQAVADAVAAGRDPRVLGEELLGRLRDVFLHRMGGRLPHLTAGDQEQVETLAGRFTDRATTRALEQVGEALLEMRQAPDPRIPLEVALVRLTRPDADTSVDGLVARIEQLERRLAAGGAAGGAAAATGTGAGDAGSSSDAGSSAAGAGPAAGSPAQRAMANLQARSAPPPPPPPPVPPSAPSGPAPSGPAPSGPAPSGPAPSGPAPSTAPSSSEPGGERPTSEPPAAGSSAADEPAGGAEAAPSAEPDDAIDLRTVRSAWTDAVLPKLSGLTKAMFSAGHVADVDRGTVIVALPNAPHRDRCATKVDQLTEALAGHFGHPIPVRLVVGDGPKQDSLLDPGSASGGGTARGSGSGRSGGGGQVAGRPETSGTSGDSGAGGPSASARGADAVGGGPHPDDEPFDHHDLEPATDVPADHIARLTDAFPGAELLDGD